jgi:hypothetical protein
VSAKLHAEDNLYYFWISDAGWYHIEPSTGTIRIPEDGDDLLREHRLWGVPTLLCAVQRGDFFLHAAAAEVNDGAVLLAAPGRHGKTTLAMGFHSEGYRVISEDSACCRFTDRAVIVPGPALLRVRPDVLNGRFPGGTNVVSVRDDRVYLTFDEKQRASDVPVPIKALIFLRESADEIYLEPLPAHKSLPDLWALSFRLPDEESRARCFKQLTGLAGTIPIWNLYRPLRLASLGATVARIAELTTKITSWRSEEK